MDAIQYTEKWEVDKDKPCIVRIGDAVRVEFTIEMDNITNGKYYEELTETKCEEWAQLIASAPTLLQENKELKERVGNLLRMFHDLTPGGSEYHNDPERCVKYVTDRIDWLEKTIKYRIKQDKANK